MEGHNSDCSTAAGWFREGKNISVIQEIKKEAGARGEGKSSREGSVGVARSWKDKAGGSQKHPQEPLRGACLQSDCRATAYLLHLGVQP